MSATWSGAVETGVRFHFSANGLPFDTASYVKLVNDELREILSVEGETAVYQMMEYHLGFRNVDLQPDNQVVGKRLRPIILLLVHEAIAGDYRQAVPLAAAVELIHNGSLIIDDIQDRDGWRRGRPTVWRLWGKEKATLVGLGMEALMNKAAFRLSFQGITNKKVQVVISGLTDAMLKMAEGQVLDLSFTEPERTVEDAYFQMIQLKTASLIEAAARLGAEVATDSAKLIGAYSRFAHYLGIAYQITDDVLGIWDSKDQMGKFAASDFLNRKVTLPIIYGLSMADARQRQWIIEIFHTEKDDAEAQEALKDILEDLGVREHCRECAVAHLQQSRRELQSTGICSEPQQKLEELLDYVSLRIS